MEKKMKIAVCSDLHLEFGPLEIKNPGVDVLILSGDILVEKDLEIYDRRQIEFETMLPKSLQYHRFFEQVCSEFPHVIYVAGNHEHYHGDFAETMDGLKRKLAYYENLHILDREVFELNDVVFVGGTLWTDMNKEDPLTLYHVKDRMNDFRCVKNSNREVTYKTFEVTEEGRQNPTFRTRPATFCPEDAVEEFRKMVDFVRVIHEGMAPWKQMVVVGHHAPSRASTHPRYQDDEVMNGAYSSELSEFILDRPGIKLWTHGHTHEDFDYMIGQCRIVCNPRGYEGYEERADHFTLKVVEL